MGETGTIVILLGVLVVLGLLVIAVGAALYFLQAYLSPEPTYMQKRLMRIKSQHEEEMSSLYGTNVDRLTRMFADRTYENAAIGKFLEKYSFTNNLKKSLSQAGLAIPVDKFVMYFLAAPFVIGFLLFVVSKNILFLLAALLVPGLSIAALQFRRGQRLAKFTKQLPDALNLVTSSLRAGHSFQSAIGVVGMEMDDPIGTEFTAMVNDINMGIPVKEAMGRLVEAVDLPDVRMLCTAVLIQREAGGNLAEVLDKLGYTIRERFKLKGQISALTGQSRLTGYVLGCAPMALFLLLSLFFPSYIAPLTESPLGQFMLGVAGVMQCIGFFIMKKVIDIRV